MEARPMADGDEMAAPEVALVPVAAVRSGDEHRLIDLRHRLHEGIQKFLKSICHASASSPSTVPKQRLLKLVLGFCTKHSFISAGETGKEVLCDRPRVSYRPCILVGTRSS